MRHALYHLLDINIYVHMHLMAFWLFGLSTNLQVPILVKPSNSSSEAFSHLDFSEEVMASQNDSGASWNMCITQCWCFLMFQRVWLHFPMLISVGFSVLRSILGLGGSMCGEVPISGSPLCHPLCFERPSGGTLGGGIGSCGSCTGCLSADGPGLVGLGWGLLRLTRSKPDKLDLSSSYFSEMWQKCGSIDFVLVLAVLVTCLSWGNKIIWISHHEIFEALVDCVSGLVSLGFWFLTDTYH